MTPWLSTGPPNTHRRLWTRGETAGETKTRSDQGKQHAVPNPQLLLTLLVNYISMITRGGGAAQRQESNEAL